MAKENVYNMKMLSELPFLRDMKNQGLVVGYMVDGARRNGPYQGANTRYIGFEQMLGAFAASYAGAEAFEGHIDYARLGNAQGLTRAGSNPWTGEHKEMRLAGEIDTDMDFDGVFEACVGEKYSAELGAEDPHLRHFMHALQYWALPYAAEKIDRPSHSKRLNRSGYTKAPFKGGMDLLADLFMSSLDDEAKTAFKAKLKARTDANKEAGRVGWGGPTQEYSERCAETREERGITMARTSTKGIGIYAKMTAEQDTECAAMLMKAGLEDHVDEPTFAKILTDYVASRCASAEKVEAAKTEIDGLTQVLNAMRAVPSMKAKADKMEAEIEAIRSKAILDAEKLTRICGPVTETIIKMMGQRYAAAEKVEETASAEE